MLSKKKIRKTEVILPLIVYTVVYNKNLKIAYLERAEYIFFFPLGGMKE
jgi:hypothetical protein